MSGVTCDAGVLSSLSGTVLPRPRLQETRASADDGPRLPPTLGPGVGNAECGGSPRSSGVIGAWPVELGRVVFESPPHAHHVIDDIPDAPIELDRGVVRATDLQVDLRAAEMFQSTLGLGH